MDFPKMAAGDGGWCILKWRYRADVVEVPSETDVRDYTSYQECYTNAKQAWFYFWTPSDFRFVVGLGNNPKNCDSNSQNCI